MMRSMTRGHWALSGAAVLMLSALVAGVAVGTETKHSAMAGSQLIPTNAELNAFTWKAIDAGTFFEVTSGVSTPNGGGATRASDGQAHMVIKINDNLALQFQSNKGAFGSRVASYVWYGTVTSAPFVTNGMGERIDFRSYRGKPSSYDAFRGGQRFDVDLAGRLGEGGFSIGLSQAGAGEVDDKNNAENTDGFFGLRGSWGNGRSIDLAAELGYEKATLKEGSSELEGSTLSLTGAGVVQVSKWSVRGALHLETGGHDAVVPEEGITELNHGMFALLGGVGRLLKDDESGQMSVEGYIDLAATAQDDVAGDNAKTGYGNVAIPGMRVGFWHKMGGAFRIMGGVSAEYRGKAKVQDDADGNRTVEKGIAGLDFFWTLGSSVTLAKKVDIDIQVHPETLPNLLSLGNTDPLIMVASVNVAL